MPTQQDIDIADKIQEADDLASKAAGRLTDAEAIAAKDNALAAMTAARDAAMAGKTAADAKIANARAAAQALLTALN